MAAKLHTFLLDFADASQREHLKAAAVGQHRAVETVELVQTASRFQHFESWTQIEVIGVAEDDLCLDVVFQFMQMHRLHRGLRAYWHEDGRLDVAMICMDDAGTGVRFRVVMFEGECHIKAKSSTSFTFST